MTLMLSHMSTSRSDAVRHGNRCLMLPHTSMNASNGVGHAHSLRTGESLISRHFLSASLGCIARATERWAVYCERKFLGGGTTIRAWVHRVSREVRG